jgi:hypothetical protein
MSAILVLPPHSRDAPKSMGKDAECVRRAGLVSHRDSFLHRLPTLQWLLGCSTSRPSVHYASALCHCASLLQPQQRHHDAMHRITHGHVTKTSIEAEARARGGLQHGIIHCWSFLPLLDISLANPIFLSKIIAAILTKVYNLSDVYDTSYMLWYTREASVAVYVANLPLIWPLLREWFPFLRNISSAQKSYGLRSYTRSRSQAQQLQSNCERKSLDLPLEHLKSPPTSCTDTSSLSAADRKGRHGIFEKSTSKRNGSPASSDYQLQTSEVEQPRSFWGKGDIRTEVTIEVEREPANPEIQMEDGSRRSMGGGYEWRSRPQREVRIEGGSAA